MEWNIYYMIQPGLEVEEGPAPEFKPNLPAGYLRQIIQWLLAEYRRFFTLFPVSRRDENHWQANANFDREYSLAFIGVAILAAMSIACVQWIDRPTVLVTYTSDSPVASSDAYRCSCALPEYLDDDPRQTCPPEPSQIKSCYLLNSPGVETITVVSFSNSTAPELLELAYSGDEEFDADGPGAPREPVFKVIHDTYLVTSSLSELDLWEPDPKKMLAPLYEDFLRYFEGMEIVDMEVETILDTKLFRFPSYYMFIMVQFDCVQYSSCGPSVILSSADPNFVSLATPNSTEAVANDWLTCGGYDGGESWDPIQNYYHGRCMIYPTYPTMSSRVKRLLGFLRDCPQIKRMGGYTNRSNVVSFISRMEQVNKSRVAEQQPMVMGFLELKPNSPQWFRLVDHYPAVRLECSASCESGGSSRGAWTEVCNASSVCLTYTTAAEVEFSSVQMRCMDFDRYNYTNCVAFANSTRNMDRVHDLCNPDASCKEVPSRKIRRQVESRTELNSMNVKILEGEIKASAKEGVCRNMFPNVVRYFSETLNQSVLLETNCSTSAGLCKLTGRYNLLDDEPGTDFPRLLHDEEVVAAASVIKPFVCYGPGKQKFTFWAITTAGVISGDSSSNGEETTNHITSEATVDETATTNETAGSRTKRKKRAAAGVGNATSS